MLIKMLGSALAVTVLLGAAPINVASQANGGVATQSSTWATAHASYANDGDTNQDFNLGMIAHTAGSEAQPWWKVVFAGNYLVESVKVYFRSDCCVQRNDGFTIHLLDSVGTSIHSVPDQDSGTGEIYELTGINVMAGGFRMVLNSNEPLQLGEVEVYGSSVPEPATTTLVLSVLTVGVLMKSRRRTQRAA